MTVINYVRNLGGGGVAAHRHCGSRAPRPVCPAVPPSDPSGALHTGGGGGFALHEAFRGCVAGVSDPHVVQFPPFDGVRTRLKAVWCPKCRPPRRKTPKTGCYGRGGLRFGHTGVCRGVLLAREPLNMRVNPLMRTSTPQHARGRGCPRSSHRVHVRVVGPRCRSSGPRAGERDQV